MEDIYKIPQQIKYQDQVIAGLTVRQALLIGAFALPAYTVFRSSLALPIKVILAVPMLACGFAFAFYPYRGRGLESWAIMAASYHVSAKDYRPPTSKREPRRISLFGHVMGNNEFATTEAHVPIQGIERGLIQTDQGYCMVLQTGSINFKLRSLDDQKKIWSSFRSFLNLLSLGFPMQVLIRVRKQTLNELKGHYDQVIQEQQNPRLCELAKAERDFIIDTVKDNSVVTRRFYLVIPYFPNFTSDADYTSIFKQAFSREKKRPEQASLDVAIKQLATRRDQAVSHLKRLGIEAHQLNDEELFELLYDFFNPTVAAGGHVKHDVKPFFDLVSEEKKISFLSPSYLKVSQEHLELSGAYLRTVTALDFPGTVYPGWIQPLIDLDQDQDISIHVTPMDSNSVIKVLNRNLSKILSTKRYRQHKGQMTDYHTEAKHDDSIFLLQKLVRSETKLFNFSLYATTRAHSLDELDEHTSSLLATLESIQVTPEVTKYQMAAALATTLPLAQDRLLCTRNMDSDSLSCTFPFSSSDLSSSGGVLYGINPDNSSLVILDRFGSDSLNSNSLVLGSSGAGKSYFIKSEALRYLIEGTSIVIIDPEREYRSICSAVGGQYITISRNPEQHINPFDPYVDADGIKGIDRQVGDATVLVGLMAPDISIQKSKLEEVLYTMFREKDEPLLSDLQRIADQKGQDELAAALFPWTEGSLSQVFSHPTDVRLDSDFVVFDISEMDTDLRPVALQVILSWLWREIFLHPKPRLIYVDEAWCLLETAGAWFSAAYRRARKHWAGITITEHQVETLMQSDVMKSILTNSSTKVLFAQEPSAVPALAAAFDLSEGEQAAIIGADKGCGLLYTANNHVSLKVVVPPEFHKFLTTSPSELYAESSNV